MIEGKSRVFGSCFGEDKFDKFKELIIGTVDSKSSKAVGSSLSSHHQVLVHKVFLDNITIKE